MVLTIGMPNKLRGLSQFFHTIINVILHVLDGKVLQYKSRYVFSSITLSNMYVGGRKDMARILRFCGLSRRCLDHMQVLYRSVIR